MDRIKKWLKIAETYIRSIGKWMLIGVIVGTVCGLIGTLFHVGVEYMTEFRGEHPWLLFLLPVFGLAITGLYKLLKVEGQNTNHILEAVHSGRQLSFLLLPAIFFSTILTHLGGGSAGREGAALQMGGTIGFHVGRLFSLQDKDIRIATMCGMAAFFSALFGTPMAATVFALGVISVGIIYHAALIPCLTGALTAYGIAILLGVEPTHFATEAPALSAAMLLKVTVLGILCAGVSILFCSAMHEAEHLATTYFKNKWLRAAMGGVFVILLTLLYGSQRYNGAGMSVIEEALKGHSYPWDFLLKILFTVITLSFGFKGGEVVPSFFTGAVFGCVVGPFLRIPAGFAAAVGLAAVFCGVVNVPLASIFLAVELFGADGMLYFAVACAMSYAFSGYKGLYSSQKILYHKLKAEYINIYTNNPGTLPEQNKDAGRGE